MWQWLQNLFGSPEQIMTDLKKELAEELNEKPKGSPYREMEVRADLPTPATPKEVNLILNIFHEAAENIAEERAEQMQTHLSDDKLRSYFRKSIRYVMDRIHNDTHDFVLLGADDAGVPKKAFFLFLEIFCKACKECNIVAERNDTYILVRKAGIIKMLNDVSTKTPPINIDAKVRAMLGN